MSEIVCPKCQAILKEGAKFCHVCGYKIPEETTQSQDSEEEKKIDVKDFTDVKPDEVLSAIKSGNIFNRAINIMFKPKSEWEVIANEKPRVPMLLFGYTFIYAIIPFITLIIGYGIIGERRLFFVHYWYRSFFTGLMNGIIFVIAAVAAIILAAIFINMLAKEFKTEQNFGRAMQLTTYSFTPMFFAGAFFMLPFMSFLVYLLGLYGVFILLTGLPILLKTPKDSQIGYFLVSAGFLYGIFFLIYFVARVIFWAIYFAIASNGIYPRF